MSAASAPAGTAAPLVSVTCPATMLKLSDETGGWLAFRALHHDVAIIQRGGVYADVVHVAHLEGELIARKLRLPERGGRGGVGDDGGAVVGDDRAGGQKRGLQVRG